MLAVLVLAICMVALYMGLMQYYAWGWLLTPLFEPRKSNLPITKVTVIVPARNESANIERVVQCLLAQNYPAKLWKFIIINDHSEDATAEIGAKLGAKVLFLPQELSGKKAAITYGISHAQGDLIITTDADCEMGPNWVSTIAQYYEAHSYKVLTGPVAFNRNTHRGPSTVDRQPKTNQLLHHFQSLDFMGLMFITAGSLRFKFPHMANGANFAFEKKLFETLNGYQGIDDTPTGDDILFLLKAHNHYPGCAGFVKSREAIVYTAATNTWANFWQQRLRWVSKSAGFGDKRLTGILMFYYCYTLAIVLAGLSIIIEPFMVLPFMLLLFGKWLPEMVMMAHSAVFFGRATELLWFVPSQLVHIYYVLRIGIESQMKRYEWKGRNYAQPKTEKK